MRKFGFKLKKAGWYHSPSKKRLEDLPKFKASIEVDNYQDFDFVRAYLIDPRNRSLYAFEDSKQGLFYQGHLLDDILILYQGQEVIAIAIGYKGSEVYMRSFRTEQEPVMQV